MKILRVIASLNPEAGGPVEFLRTSVPQLAAHGISFEVVTVDPPDAPWVTGAHGLKVNGMGPGRLGWGFSLRLLRWLMANVRRFDAVFCDGLWLFPTWAVWLSLKKHSNKIPYFVMPHGMLDPYFQDMRIRPWKTIRNIVYWKLIENRVIRDAAAVIFTCEEERRLARQPFRPYACREVVVNFGTAAPPLRTDSMATAFAGTCPGLEGRSYFLFLSRLHPKKGIDLLLRAYESCFNWQTSSSVCIPDLVIAGPVGDESYVAGLRGILGKAPAEMQRKVHFPGMLTGDAKWGSYYGCEAFILPSHQENFGIVVAESLACGKPVLISNKVNIWQEIHEGGAGLVEEDSLEGTIQLLTRWRSLSIEEKQEMGRRAKEVFLRRFTVEGATQSLANVLKEILQT